VGGVAEPHPDLVVAFALADLADRATLRHWSPNGVVAKTKVDGTPVTVADVAAEEAVLAGLAGRCPDDGFVGEEVGARSGATGRRWIVDGIDGTRFFAAGDRSWGTLIALESDGEVLLGLATSPALDRRWWAVRGRGAFTGRCTSTSDAARIRVSTRADEATKQIATLPVHDDLDPRVRELIGRLSGGSPAHPGWCQQLRVAEGELDMCVWFCGDVWDHAAPSVIVEEAGGRFTDHTGGSRLDTRTGLYSNGAGHDDVLAAIHDAAGTERRT
jgi:histidinol-phosphatase